MGAENPSLYFPLILSPPLSPFLSLKRQKPHQHIPFDVGGVDKRRWSLFRPVSLLIDLKGVRLNQKWEITVLVNHSIVILIFSAAGNRSTYLTLDVHIICDKRTSTSRSYLLSLKHQPTFSIYIVVFRVWTVNRLRSLRAYSWTLGKNLCSEFRAHYVANYIKQFNYIRCDNLILTSHIYHEP